MVTLSDLPRVVDDKTWRTARLELLEQEKLLSKQRDSVARMRRALPMRLMSREYTFASKDGPKTLLEMAQGRPQLIIYHCMFEPQVSEACPSCSMIIDSIGPTEFFKARNTTVAIVARAPIQKLLAYQERMHWEHLDFYSSYESEFNYDMQVTTGDQHKEYNYTTEPHPNNRQGEQPGTSCFYIQDDKIYHTHSMFARGLDILVAVYNWLDLTVLGRQEDQELPKGRADGPFMHWVKRKDEYVTQANGKCDACD